MSDVVHKFELAGLGKAPYRFLGVSEHLFQACAGEPVRAGASCDFCGASIKHAANFESADGKHFKVGCDCAYSAESNKAVVRQIEGWQRKHEREVREARRERKAEKLAAEYAALLSELDAMAAGEPGFASSFASSVAAQIRYGKKPSPKQLACLDKLRAEVAHG